MPALRLDHREIASILLDVESGLSAILTLGEGLDDPKHELLVQVCCLLRPMVGQLTLVQETLSSYWMFVDDAEETTPCPPIA